MQPGKKLPLGAPALAATIEQVLREEQDPGRTSARKRQACKLSPEMCRSKNAEAVIINVDAKMNELGRRLEAYRQGDALRDLQSTDSVIVDCIGPRIDEIRVLPYKGSQEIVEWLPEHGLTTGQMNNFRKWWPLAGCDDSRVDRVSAGYKSEPFQEQAQQTRNPRSRAHRAPGTR